MVYFLLSLDMKPIGITLGDPAGIGPEVILKALLKFKRRPFLIIGSYKILEKMKRTLGISLNLKDLVLNISPEFNFDFGKPQRVCGLFSYQAVKIGVELIKRKRILALVTAPISKKAWQLAGIEFPGHTELLAHLTNTKRYAMLAWTKKLKIAFLTTHLPLKRVSSYITKRRILEKIELLNEFLKEYLRIASPCIAVLGFNPHIWEFSMGEEERILEGIEEVKERGIRAEGPFPSDSIGGLMGRYDGFLAMYHDQGMIPSKLLSKRGVNITLGLPFIRTSPLHGTAFDIAGRGIASEKGMEEAIRVALKLSSR